MTRSGRLIALNNEGIRGKYEVICVKYVEICEKHVEIWEQHEGISEKYEGICGKYKGICEKHVEILEKYEGICGKYMVSGTSPPCKLTAVALGGTSVWGGREVRAVTLGVGRRGKANLKRCPCKFHIYNRDRTQNIQRHETWPVFFG